MVAVRAGEQAPDVAVSGSRGRLQLSQAWSAGPLVLAFVTELGTPRCDAMLGLLAQAQEELGPASPPFVVISADPPERSLGRPEDFAFVSDAGLELASLFGVADLDARRASRALFVVGRGGVVAHANPFFNPDSMEQVEAALAAMAG